MTYYEVLGIHSSATDEEIKFAYKKLAKKFHPDIYRGDKAYATNKMQSINEAYSILFDHDLREEYDFVLQRNSSTSSGYADNNNYYDDSETEEDTYSYEYSQSYENNINNADTTTNTSELGCMYSLPVITIVFFLFPPVSIYIGLILLVLRLIATKDMPAKRRATIWYIVIGVILILVGAFAFIKIFYEALMSYR
jgi:hypothetical protein